MKPLLAQPLTAVAALPIRILGKRMQAVMALWSFDIFTKNVPLFQLR